MNKLVKGILLQGLPFSLFGLEPKHTMKKQLEVTPAPSSVVSLPWLKINHFFKKITTQTFRGEPQFSLITCPFASVPCDIGEMSQCPPAPPCTAGMMDETLAGKKWIYDWK